MPVARLLNTEKLLPQTFICCCMFYILLHLAQVSLCSIFVNLHASFMWIMDLSWPLVLRGGLFDSGLNAGLSVEMLGP